MVHAYKFSYDTMELDSSRRALLPLYGAKKVRFILNKPLALFFSLREHSFDLLKVNDLPEGVSADYEFPVINGKSPSKLTLGSGFVSGNTIEIFISEYGGIPSDDYWEL